MVKSVYFKTIWQAVLAGCVILSSTAQAADNSWTVQKLMQELSQVSSASLQFRETRESLFLSTDLVVEGEIQYRAPDYIEKITRSPMSEKVVVQGDTMLVEKVNPAKKDEVVVETRHYSIESHPLLKATVGSIRSIMSGDTAMLDEYYDMAITGKCENWTLELVPKTEEISSHMQKIIMSGNESSILKYVTVQPDGEESVMTLTYDQLSKGNQI